MVDEIAKNFILAQLCKFQAGPRCCQQFCGSFRSQERFFFNKYSIELGFCARPYVQSGIEVIKVYKRSCLHLIEDPVHLHLQPLTTKELFLLQRNGDFVGTPHEMQMSGDFFSPSTARPAVPPHRFSIGSLKQSMARQNIRGQLSFQESCNLQPYKQRLLDAVRDNRVLVVNGATSFDKSTALPMYIIENCADRRAHCKIICVEREQLVAIYNSERLAKHLGEKVGNTVAFQVHLQSRISEGSNLIYTTASVLLRVLMGKSSIDSFRHISHIVVADVQMHEAFGDVLLCELRGALRCHEHLRVVLLSNSHSNAEFLKYFGEGNELRLEETGAGVKQAPIAKVLYLDSIHKIVAMDRQLRPPTYAYAIPPSVMRDFGNNREYLDNCLEVYDRSGTDQSLDSFLYMVRGEYASINYRHSVSGSTAAIIASKLGKPTHLRTLLQLYADPFLMNEQNLNAISSAVAGGNIECIELLCAYCGTDHSIKDANPSFFDYNLVTDLIRLLITGSEYKIGHVGICFRLIPRVIYDKLPEVCTPQLLTMPLDRICLTVKLLSPHQIVAEYLQGTIVRPPFIHVHHTVDYLKKLDVFDELDDVTWLGCRLIDVPVDCQLGKLLVFAILLQCLDPVLTIVSFVATMDPLKLPTEMDGLLQPYVAAIRNKMKQKRKSLTEGILSDHLMYIRLYQEWQNELQNESPELALLDQHNFVLNGILEKVFDMRTNLVGALRSSQLIHNQGQLDMHYINQKSSSWPMVKAALVGGLYPNICKVDSSFNRFKSAHTRELRLHPSSVLRKLEVEPLNISTQKFPTPWMIYGYESKSGRFNSISNCTLVAPLTIAMFAGPTKMHSANIAMQFNESNPVSGEKNCSGNRISNYYLDEWIWFIMRSSDAQLVFKTRQYFYTAYTNYLQNCGNMDKWRRSNIILTQIPRLFDTIENVLMQEDKAWGFSQPDNVGLRPKAVPNKFVASFNSAISWKRGAIIPHSITSVQSGKFIYKSAFLEVQFFMVYLSEETDIAMRKYTPEWLRDSVAKVVEPHITSEKLTFVIMYKKSPDHFCTVALAKRCSGIFKLQECFKNKVPIYELIYICSKYNIYIPSFNERCVASQLDKRVGSIILDLFAFRNNWLHNN